MADYYSGTLDDVKRVAKNIRVGEDVADDTNFAFTPAQAERFQAEADSVINARLRSIYLLPLRKVTLPGGVLDYPDPIPKIARELAASLMAISAYQESEPAFTESAKQMYESADKTLNDLVAGLTRGTVDMQGQHPMARDAFIDPYTAPLGAPPRPRT